MSDDTKREYPKPSLTADVVVVAPGATGDERRVRVLFIARANKPFQGAWALPGGFVEPNETVAEAAVRELAEETSLTGVVVEELGCWSKPGRDPRGWTVTIAHLARVPAEAMSRAKAGDDAAKAAWLDLTIEARGFRLEQGGEPVSPHELAFDHGDILAAAVTRLRGA